jgi:chromosome segregation ATPase
MKKKVKWSLGLLSMVILALITGCAAPRDTSIITNSDSETSDPVASRFKTAQEQGDAQTVIESAVELSDEYAQLRVKALDLYEKNQVLTGDNEQLQKEIETVEAKLKEAEAELREANALLVDMVGELNEWKASVMGFRNEMRQAATAQLEALLKVLESLGVETELNNLQTTGLGSTGQDT